LYGFLNFEIEANFQIEIQKYFQIACIEIYVLEFKKLFEGV